MLIKNFGYLQNSANVTPDELKAYLKAHSSINSKVKDKQFHAVISCKGREFDKERLTQIAEAWLQKMGYGNNPYLIVHHSDTKNNHVHIVSTRIGTDGKKIKDSMERVKAQTFIQEIMKKDPKLETGQLINDLKQFNYSTISQARLYIELRGYECKQGDDKLVLFKYGKLQGEMPLFDLKKYIESYQAGIHQKNQLKAIFHKYQKIYDASPIAQYEPLKGNRLGKLLGYRSELSAYLKEKFGVELIYHGKAGKPPYGYTIIDHSKKHIYKGGEIMPLKDIIQLKGKEQVKTMHLTNLSDKVAYEKTHSSNHILLKHHHLDNKLYRLKLLSAMQDFSTLSHGLDSYQLRIVNHLGQMFL